MRDDDLYLLCQTTMTGEIGNTWQERAMFLAEKLKARLRSDARPASSDGIKLIAAERERQVTAEGYDAAHDDAGTPGDLSDAAACYALSARTAETRMFGVLETIEVIWPWSLDVWKPTGDAVRDLVKAGALIVAEIDRHLRLRGEATPFTLADFQMADFDRTAPATPSSEGSQSTHTTRAMMAGPELLAALKRVVAVADRQTDDFEEARRAIAKAER